MNKYQRFLFTAVFAVCSLAAFAQFGVGVRDNRSIMHINTALIMNMNMLCELTQLRLGCLHC